jgi:hypothetical protein
MAEKSKISIANLSWLSDTSSFLLQTSKKSKALTSYINENLPKDQRKWLSDLVKLGDKHKVDTGCK